MLHKSFIFPLLFIPLSLSAQDTLTIVGRTLDDIEVVARVEQPTTNHTTMSGTELNEQNTGQNLPYLLSQTPSLLVTSDDGLGVGYTYFRLRGTDHTRINMTVNDVPLNDQESQTVFWVNITDMAGSLSSLNVQRGVGTSTNGSAAFGGSINMETSLVDLKKSLLIENNGNPLSPLNSHFEIGFNGGMYNTFREYAKADIALSNNWFAQARFSKVNSDGYLERAASDLYSYHGALGYIGDRTKVSLTVFGGKEKTYMAWDGVSFDDLKENPRYNPAGEYTDDNGETAYYPNQNDYYAQQHAQLHLTQTLIDQLFLDVTLHYTHGNGYYEQYKANKKFTDYGLSAYTDSEGNTVKKSDFVREKHLDNHFYGGIVSLKYITEPADLQFGLAANNYQGQHWGNITYIRDPHYPYGLPYDYEFYRSQGDKLDINTYIKANWRIINKAQEQLTLYGDLQYRYVHYQINGINDEDLAPIPVDETFNFFNPKAGITYSNHGHQTYFNFAIANREPSRKNYTEAGPNDIPRPERLYDYELGYNYQHRIWHIGVNLYFMDYKNQLVLTGKYSDTGAYLTKNVDKSYRMGAELTVGVRPVDWFMWEANMTISRNKILGFTDWVDYYNEDWDYVDYDNPQKEVEFGDVTIAFSPNVVFNNTFRFMYKGFMADLQTQVVSKQYLDNTMSDEAALPAYTTTNFNVEYTLPLPEKCPRITLRGQINNMFNARYASNGGNWMCQFEDGTRYYSPWVYAQAGINVHAGFVVRF